MDTTPRYQWWKDAVIYQVLYPANFKDSGGDGTGDIPDILEKVPYLADLGVDVVGPQYDMGYDISDCEAVYPPYGTLDNIDQLISSCHEHGMKIILDLVINHPSTEHSWFKESRSYFAGSTWTWDKTTQECYLQLYAKEQPDLNWDNPKTREAIYNSAIRFWLERGVDGFSVDTVNKYSKYTEFKDAPIVDLENFIQPAPQMLCNGPNIHEYLKEIKAKVYDQYNAFTVDPKQVLQYVSAKEKELDMVFQFDMIHLDGTGWTTVFIEIHDNGRAVSLYGCDAAEFRDVSAKMLALFQIGLTGTLYIYQGQEIGMINAPKEWPIEEYKDIEAQGYYIEAERVSKMGSDPSRLERITMGLQLLARDHSRLPTQWNALRNSGFSTGIPWMRFHDLYPEINVAKQQDDPNSVMSFYKHALKVRKQFRGVLIHGSYNNRDFDNEEVYCFSKTSEKQKAIIVLNFATKNQPLLSLIWLKICL
ncbi:glycoside hydrolase superfamily [Dipodascopsis uninucleata]